MKRQKFSVGKQLSAECAIHSTAGTKATANIKIPAYVNAAYNLGLYHEDLKNHPEWIKNNYPILTARSVKGEYGTGHNAYVIDESGTVWNTYHARFGVDAPRSSAIRRVHFDIDGAPMLDVTEELDIKDSLKDIQIIVEVSNM